MDAQQDEGSYDLGVEILDQLANYGTLKRLHRHFTAPPVAEKD